MRLFKEFKERGFTSEDPKIKIHCKFYEDNSGALEMAKEYKYRPRTKFLNFKHHHFRDFVERGELTIHKVLTHDQRSYYLIKPLDEVTHNEHKKKVQGW